MTPNRSLFSVLSLLVVLFLSSCSDDEATVASLSGKYVLTEFEAKNCTSSEDNFKLSNGPNGLCATMDGEEFCIDVCMTFNNSTYTIIFTTKAGGFTFSANDSGTYDPDSNDVELCIDGECNNLEITNNGNRIRFSYTDPDDGCDTFLTLEKS